MNVSKEQRILRVMRKVLGSIVRDTTPPPGMQHPLKDTTIEDIRQCFALISARERELMEEAGIAARERPRYPGDAKSTEVLHFQRKRPGGPEPADD